MDILNDIVKFLKKFWTVIGTWIMSVILKYKFKNALMLGIAFWFWFGMAGGFWAHLGWATFYIWIGINLESIMTVFRELRDKNGW